MADLYDPREQWASYLLNAIKAKELFKREVNYIVKGGEIIIVDEFTGRTMPGRRWSDGLHQVPPLAPLPCCMTDGSMHGCALCWYGILQQAAST